MLSRMEQNIILSNGHEIPPIGLGTCGMFGTKLGNAIKTSIKLGYRLIDTAYIYQNEAQIGILLNEIFTEGTINRNNLFIVSKLWNNQHRANDVIPAIKNSLSKLQLQYLDLYLIHWPIASKPSTNLFDIYSATEEDDITIEETWRAMEKCVNLGYTKSIGISNFNSIQIERILKIATVNPVVNEIQLGVVPIPKSSNFERLKENCDTLNFAISPDDVKELQSLNRNIRCVDHETYKNYKEYPFTTEF